MGPLQGAKGLQEARPQGTRWRSWPSRHPPGGKPRLREPLEPNRPNSESKNPEFTFLPGVTAGAATLALPPPGLAAPRIHELVSLGGHQLGLFHSDIPGRTRAGLSLLPRDCPRGLREGPGQYKANLSLRAQGASLDLELSQTQGGQTLSRSQAREAQN